MADTNWNQQLQAMHQMAMNGKLKNSNLLAVTTNSQAAQPKVPVATPMAPSPAPTSSKVKPPMAVAPPKAPAQAQPYGGVPAPTDPAMIGGNVMTAQRKAMEDAATEASKTPSAVPPPNPTPTSKIPELRKGYLDTFSPSADETGVQSQLEAISGRQAMLKANEQAGETNVAEQPIAMSLIGGQQAALQRQLNARLGQESAQAVPLQARLAAYQAQREARQNASKAELDFATKDEEGQKPIEVGGSLVRLNPQTGKYDEVDKGAEKTGTKTASVQEYEYAKENGYKGSFSDYQNEDANRKRVAAGGSQDENRLLTPAELQLYNKPAGTRFSDVMGMVPSKPLTDAQSKASVFGERTSQANDILNNTQAEIVGMNPAIYGAQLFMEPNTIGNTMVSDTIRQTRQAERNFLNAVLRRESGAVISPSEFAEGAKQYFPRPGDDAQTLAQKAQNRQTQITALQREGGGQGQQSDTFTSSDGTTYQKGADGLYYPKANSGQPSALKTGNAKSIADAIKKVESGGDYNARGASGEFGAYQFMPTTWKGWAQTYLGDANAPMTPENQDRVAEAHVSSLLSQGRTPEEIALIWNGGQPVRKAGVNKYGVRYDSGAYADKVLRALNA